MGTEVVAINKVIMADSRCALDLTEEKGRGKEDPRRNRGENCLHFELSL